MLKVYSSQRTSLGQDPSSWEENWHHADLESTLRTLSDDFLSGYFRRYLSPTGVNYEGGCGSGQYVVHYQREGYRMLGADFATKALRRIRDQEPGAQLQAADITRIPLRDDSVSFYYSGGVVEHFEEGPTAALDEAWRVIGPDGHLLITVPFVNLIRKRQFKTEYAARNWEGHWLRRVNGFSVDEPVEGTRFMEYRLTAREFRRVLDAHRFKPITLRPFSLLAGEFSLLLSRGNGAAVEPSGMSGPAINGAAHPRSAFKQYIVDVLSKEKPSGLPFRPVVRALSHASAHMILAVCQPIGKD